jgi:uncharacterized protein DUF6356
MQSTLHRLFLSHPQTVDETYGEHFTFALGFALRLLGAGLAALVHAIIPCLFETTASRMIREMHARIASRGHQPAAGEVDEAKAAPVAG